MADSGDTLETKKREQDNYKRINRLLQSVATSVVRRKFDSEFSPDCLTSTINKSRIDLGKLRNQKCINQFQYTLLFPSNGEPPSSSSFDITLMIFLLRNLGTKVKILDSLPEDTDTSVAANLSRLKYYRNKVAHSQTFTLSIKDFKIWWKHIAKAICELGGESYIETCKKLKYCNLDQNEKDLPLAIKKIVKSVREPDTDEYIYWINDTDRYFPNPIVIDKITASFEKHHFIVISGQAGTGKTALARYVALNLHKNQDMSIFPINNPNIIQHQLALRSQINCAAHKLKVKKMPVSGKKKQTKQTKPIKVLALDTHGGKTNQSILIFVIDDFLGRYTINKRMTNAWKELYYNYFYIPSNDIHSIYILATCREETRVESQFTSLKDLYKFEVYDTSVFEDNGYEQNIASCHMNPSDNKILFSDENIKKNHKFATRCFLYSHLLLPENVDFFNNPNFAFIRELKGIRSHSEPCYIGLALLTLFDGKLCKPLSDKISVELVSKLCVECKLSTKDMKLYQIQQELDIVVGRYIIDEVTAYSIVHPELYEILLHYFIKKIPESLIAFGSNDFLQTQVKLEGFAKDPSNLAKNYAHLYFNRLIEDIKEKKFENAFRNMQVANTAYQQELIEHVQKSDEVLQILASSCLPLILSVENDFSEFIDLILKTREKLGLSREIVVVRQDDFDVIDYDDRELLKLELSNNDEEIILMFACLCGSVHVVKLLLDLGYYINYQNSMQKAPIHLACLRGEDEVVKVLLGIQSTAKEDDKSLETDCDIDIQDVNGLTALHMACRNGHTNVVNLLLKKWKFSSSDTDEQGRIVLFAEKFSVTDNQGRNALHLAAVNGSADIIEMFFQTISFSDSTGPGRHAKYNHETTDLCNLINTRDKHGKTFLFTACENDKSDCVEFLLKYRCCNTDLYNDRNETPVFRACQNDNTELVDILIKRNADVNIKDITRRTPLHVSVENKNEDMVKRILNNENCNVNAKNDRDDVNAKNDEDDDSYSALHFAVFRKNINIVKILLNAECNVKCDINLTHLDRKTPLMTAVSTGSTDIVDLLIDRGCDLNKYDSDGKKAFHIACENNYNGDIIELFLKRKEDFDVNDVDSVLGRTGLHHAVTGNNIKAVKLLLKTKININLQDKYLKTAIHHAYRCSKLEIVKELLKSQECNINLPDNTGKNLLQIACKNNDILMVRTLLRKNCAINARDEVDRTPLHMTMDSNYMDIFTILVNKSDLNDKNMNGQTLLHIACREHRVGAVELILRNACDVNIQDNSGKTALHIAAEGDDLSIVKELLKVKCNVDLCDTSGKTALSYARENRNKEIVKKFKLFMEDIENEKK